MIVQNDYLYFSHLGVLTMFLLVYLYEKKAWVFGRTIYHNLTQMAKFADCYLPLWQPELINAKKAKHLIPVLEHSLSFLKDQKDKCEKFNPEDGWGSYENLLDFVTYYLQACKDHPNAKISVSH